MFINFSVVGQSILLLFLSFAAHDLHLKFVRETLFFKQFLHIWLHAGFLFFFPLQVSVCAWQLQHKSLKLLSLLFLLFPSICSNSNGIGAPLHV
jgi:hypothetical protein